MKKLPPFPVFDGSITANLAEALKPGSEEEPEVDNEAQTPVEDEDREPG